MSYNALNYTAQGGATTVIGGTLDVNGTIDVTGATLTGFPDAIATVKGFVKKAANVPEAAGANPTAAEFKALLDALIAAGVMAAGS